MEKRSSYAEFSSQLNEKNIVVIEFGRHYTRCGFAGELAPRAIIETRTNQGTYLHDIKEPKELTAKLGEFVERLYFNYLAVSPEEKKVIVVEFNVPSILFVPDHLMALATLGRSTGLIVDIGALEAISIATVDGVTLLDGAQFASLGAKKLDQIIGDELARVHAPLKDLKPDVIEDIRVKACFVAPFERGLKMTKDKSVMQSKAIRLAHEHKGDILIEDRFFLSMPDAQSPVAASYPLGGRDIIKIPGNLREGACEIFFELIGHEHSLTTMIVETILMAPIDCRRALAENILVIGGLANLPGLEHRLCEELKHIDQYERFKRKIPDNFLFHRPLCPRNYVSWLGASMFCTPSSMDLRATTRDQWLRDGKKNPRDWSDLIR